MLNRILETELANLRRRNAELQDDLLASQRADRGHYSRKESTEAKSTEYEMASGRESLIAQLESKNIEVSIIVSYFYFTCLKSNFFIGLRSHKDYYKRLGGVVGVYMLV